MSQANRRFCLILSFFSLREEVQLVLCSSGPSMHGTGWSNVRDVSYVTTPRFHICHQVLLSVSHASCIVRLQFFGIPKCCVSFCSCMPNLGSLVSIASYVGSGILHHLDLLLLLVDELTHTFQVPKLPDVVCDETVKPSCIWPVCIGCACGFCVGVLLTALFFRRNERANSESTEPW